MLVHDGGDLFVLKGFALHDVAPVAGGVADAEQDRFVLHFCLVQGFLAPWVPVYRVVCVLPGHFVSLKALYDIDCLRCHALAKAHSRGSTGSLSRASTPKTHSWTRRKGSFRTKRSN